MLQFRPKRTRLIVVAVIAVLLGLAGFSPNYSRVMVTGGDQDIDVERAGFGPQQIRVKSGDTRIESSAR